MSKPIVKLNSALQRFATVGSLLYPLVAHTCISVGYPLWAVAYLITLIFLMVLVRINSIYGRIVFISTILIMMWYLARHHSELVVNAVYLPPVLIPAWLAVIFIGSLSSPQGAIITRVAEIMDGAPLDGERIRYTRRLTLIWSVLFCFMVAEAVSLAIWTSFAIWSWWVHIGNYAVIIAVFIIEIGVRQYLFGGRLRVGAQLRALSQRPWYGHKSND